MELAAAAANRGYARYDFKLNFGVSFLYTFIEVKECAVEHGVA